MLPTRILLVHGAFADGSSWSKVIPDDIAVVKNQLVALNAESDVPIVVAGHSFGGFVITNAVTDAPNTRARR